MSEENKDSATAPAAAELPQSDNEVDSRRPRKESQEGVVSVHSPWTKHAEFVLSGIGYAVGLGNVWRFPYLCYRHGGGTFLIPYCIVMLVCGLPLFYLELALGQYNGQGPNTLFKHLSPAFQGVGVAMLIITFMVVIYYNVIMGWTLFYMFGSFKTNLDYANCNHTWNSENCMEYEKARECLVINMVYRNRTCMSIDLFCKSFNETWRGYNNTHCTDDAGEMISVYSMNNRVSPSEDYFKRYMLNQSSSINEIGGIRWHLALCLLLAWLVIYFSLVKGVKSSGKVVYFTALFPYVVLTILLIRGITLKGSGIGVRFFFVPKWSELVNAQTWGDAAGQTFYSLGLGFGGIMTLASYNKFHNNIRRDAITIVVANFVASILAGLVIFSVMGFMSYQLGVPIDQVVKAGPGLAFIAYPEAVSMMPLAPLWAFLFFIMLITLGLDSQFTMCETLVTAVTDEWPSLEKYPHFLIVGFICLVCFLLGLPLCTRGGIYLFTVMDRYSGKYSLIVVSSLEIFIVCWLYGLKRFEGNLRMMLGRPPSRFWPFCWKYVSLVVLLGIMIYNIVNHTPIKYGGKLMPSWANVIGWLMVCSSLVVIPIFAAYEIYKVVKYKRKWMSAFNPSSSWGPSMNGLSSMQSRIQELNESQVHRDEQNPERVEIDDGNNPERDSNHLTGKS